MPTPVIRLRNLHLLFTGVMLTLSVSLATAAIVMWMPDSPVYVASGRGDQQVARNMNDEYVQLHRSRSAVVPNYLRVDVRQVAQ